MPYTIVENITYLFFKNNDIVGDSARLFIQKCPYLSHNFVVDVMAKFIETKSVHQKRRNFDNIIGNEATYS